MNLLTGHHGMHTMNRLRVWMQPIAPVTGKKIH
jgi:hypothetical protein